MHASKPSRISWNAQRCASRSVIAFGLAALVVLAPSAHADGPVTSSVSTQPPSKPLSPSDWRTLSLASRRILRHADLANTALADKKNDVALANINKGLLLLQIIDKILPVSTVKTEIKASDLTYQDEDQVKPAFVPIFGEADEFDVVSDVTAEQQKKPVAAKPKAGASQVMVPEVTYAGFDYSGMKLNVRLANSDLHQAQDRINQGDTSGASAALQDLLGNGVIFEFSTVDQPLARAMDNLRLSEMELNNDQPLAAKTALDAASDELARYTKVAGESRSKDVEQLRKEIAADAKNITQYKKDTFSAKIAGWWGRMLAWVKK
jgi:hypothetical protein